MTKVLSGLCCHNHQHFFLLLNFRLYHIDHLLSFVVDLKKMGPSQRRIKAVAECTTIVVGGRIWNNGGWAGAYIKHYISEVRSALPYIAREGLLLMDPAYILLMATISLRNASGCRNPSDGWCEEGEKGDWWPGDRRRGILNTNHKLAWGRSLHTTRTARDWLGNSGSIFKAHSTTGQHNYSRSSFT